MSFYCALILYIQETLKKHYNLYSGFTHYRKIEDSLTLDLLKRSFSLMKTLHKRLNALSQSCDSLHLLNIVPKFLHSLLLKRKIDTVLILVH